MPRPPPPRSADQHQRQSIIGHLCKSGLIAATRGWVAESRASRPRGVDLVGAALFGVGIASLLAALTQARQGLTSPAVLILVAAAVLFLGVFVVHQRRATTVMVEPRLFRRPALISVLALSENDQF